MRRGGTTLVVLVVAAIALAASYDALRGEDEPQPAAETAPPPAPPTTTLADPRGGAGLPPTRSAGRCTTRTRAASSGRSRCVPDEPAVEPPNWDECRFVLSPDGRRVSGAGSGWAPRAGTLFGRLFQSEDGTIQVSNDDGPEGAPFAGTAPAWRPDGTLTYFADGAVREWPSGDVVLSQRALRAVLRAAASRSVPVSLGRLAARGGVAGRSPARRHHVDADRAARGPRTCSRSTTATGWRPGGSTSRAASPISE